MRRGAFAKLTIFLRFVVRERDHCTGESQGVFTALYALERSGKLAPYELEWFRSAEEWFNTHLKAPERLARSKRSGAAPVAITWLKASAQEHITRMRELVALLKHKDLVVEELRTDTPGYVVYEDEYQVAAVPFEDTLKP